MKPPSLVLSEEACDDIAANLSLLWFETSGPHKMILCVAGWFARKEVALESVKAIISVVSVKIGGDKEKLLQDVEAVYARLIGDEPIPGKGELEKTIENDFGHLPKVRQRFDMLVHSITKRLPRHHLSKQKHEFEILLLVKVKTEPPFWIVTIEKEGKKLVTQTTNARLVRYESFSEDVLAQNSMIPETTLKNSEWRARINEAIASGHYQEKMP